MHFTLNKSGLVTTLAAVLALTAFAQVTFAKKTSAYAASADPNLATGRSAPTASSAVVPTVAPTVWAAKIGMAIPSSLTGISGSSTSASSSGSVLPQGLYSGYLTGAFINANTNEKPAVIGSEGSPKKGKD